MAHFNTLTIEVDGKTAILFTILNMNQNELSVLNDLVQGLPIDVDHVNIARDIKKQVLNMASQIAPPKSEDDKPAIIPEVAPPGSPFPPLSINDKSTPAP